jgi:hypothetical protein
MAFEAQPQYRTLSTIEENLTAQQAQACRKLGCESKFGQDFRTFQYRILYPSLETLRFVFYSQPDFVAGDIEPGPKSVPIKVLGSYHGSDAISFLLRPHLGHMR